MGGRQKGKVQWVIFSYICFQIDNLLETIIFFKIKGASITSDIHNFKWQYSCKQALNKGKAEPHNISSFTFWKLQERLFAFY